MSKRISLLGSTGSIGRQTLDVIDACGMEVAAITANSSVDVLEEQARRYGPELAVLMDEKAAADLKVRLADTSVKVLAGMDGLMEAAALPSADTVLTAVVGMVGLRPTMAAIREGKRIALANKETLVCGGELVMEEAHDFGAEILPVDSEHSAIFQCLQSGAHDEIEEILLTASGGPFRDLTAEQITDVTVDQALAHPNWSMGKKITIDSATMINKGLEIIEACWLFQVPIEKIHVLVQPDSVIHSMVQFQDGAVIAQMGTPDMKLPIQYAMFYPKRAFLGGERLKFEQLKSIHFAKPNPALRGIELASEAFRRGGSMTTVMNAANEYAVAKFLNREIFFTDIYRWIEYAMDHHSVIQNPSLEEILKTEQETYTLLEKDRNIIK